MTSWKPQETPMSHEFFPWDVSPPLSPDLRPAARAVPTLPVPQQTVRGQGVTLPTLEGLAWGENHGKKRGKTMEYMGKNHG